MNSSNRLKLFLLAALFLVAITAALSIGAVDIPFARLFDPQNRAILLLRLTRVILGLVAGCGLAVSGISLQAVLRNPLAEPYLLGTSSGAGLGAVIAILAGLSGVPLPLAAFVGAFLTMALVYRLARQGARVPLQSLILSGVIVSIALSAVMLFIISVAAKESLHSELWWLWGSLYVFDIRLLYVVGTLVLAGTGMLFAFYRELNAISIGEEEAMHLGIETEKLKKAIFFLTSLVTAAVVCVCGTIGFVGLIIPHAMRMVVGPNHKVLIPVSCVAGGIFLVLCDLLARKLFAPMEIPIGVITAAIGAPLFILLLKNKERLK
ncbi:MAG: FecCD family ABC transporter permease [Deltaproteobacteria bacterium]